MKRTVLTSVLLFAAIITLSAQSVVGHWQSKFDNDGQEVNVVMVFTNDGKFTLKMSQDMNSPEIGDMNLLLTIPGTYKMKDAKNMTVSLESDKADIKFDMKLSKALEDAFKQQPEKKDEFMKQMRDTVVGTAKKEFNENPIFDGNMAIKSVTATTLVVEPEDDDELTMTRVK